jgi:hypothetical protein
VVVFIETMIINYIYTKTCGFSCGSSFPAALFPSEASSPAWGSPWFLEKQLGEHQVRIKQQDQMKPKIKSKEFIFNMLKKTQRGGVKEKGKKSLQLCSPGRYILLIPYAELQTCHLNDKKFH